MFVALPAVLALPPGASAATKVVTMGEPVASMNTFERQYSSDVNDFFPHGVKIHVGDKVKFVPAGFHTVDLPPRGGGALPGSIRAGSVSGSNDAAGGPFWFNGLPKLVSNPAVFGPGKLGKSVTYDGSKRVESGAPLSRNPKPMLVTFTKAGSFTYLCEIHAGMKGVVKVVAKSKSVPSAKADAKAVKTEVARDLKAAKALANTQVPAGTVSVGASASHGVEYFGFFPSKVTVPAGTTLRFAMSSASFEEHTATTGPGDPDKEPSSYLGKLAGSLQGPAPDPAFGYPSDRPGAPASLTPTLHGNGFWNSGLMDTSATTPLSAANAVTFSQAGTYEFYCLIHTSMHATVTVQ